MESKAGTLCVFGILLDASLLGIVLCISGNATAVSWSIETVDSIGDVGELGHLALDSSGYAHIAYYDYGNDRVKYAHWTGSNWVKNTVGTAGSHGYDGRSISIALDSGGTPHISFYHSSSVYSGELKYAMWTGSTWSVTTVDSTSDAGLASCIAMDSNGRPRISYYDYENGDLKYAEWTGSTWSLKTVDSSNDVGLLTSMVLDSNGLPHISYVDNTHNSLKYAKWTGSDWNIVTVGTVGEYGGSSSIALRNGDQPLMSFYYSTSMSTGSLRFAEWTGAYWNITTIDSIGDQGLHNSLALDYAGNPRIAYHDYGDGHLKYAEWRDFEWSISVIDWNSDVGGFPSLAFRGGIDPQISYYDSANGDLKYASGIGENVPPYRPPAPSGPYWGRVGTSYTYSAKTTDPNGDMINYTFDWGDGDTSDAGPLPSGTVASLSHSWTSVGTYEVKVVAIDEHGLALTWSAPLVVEIVSIDSPGPPEISWTAELDQAVSLTWTAPLDDGGYAIVNYTLYRGTLPSSESMLVKLGNVRSYDDTGLTNGQTYYYRITASNTVTEGPMSPEVNATPSSVPSAPVLNATAGDGFVSLMWSEPSDDGGSPVTHYQVYRDGTLIASVVTTYYDDMSLTNGVSYSYAVRAVNVIGASPDSNVVSATPRAAAQTSILQEPWFWLLIIIVIVIVAAAIAVAVRRGSKKKAAAQPPVVEVRQPYYPVPARVAPRPGAVQPPQRVSRPAREYSPPPPPPPEPETPATPAAPGAFTEAKCPFCGNNLAADSTFCVMCGRRI